MDRVDAVLLAGGKQGSKKILEDNKAFLSLKGIPLFLHVLRSLLEAKRIGNVVIVGPSARINDAIKKDPLKESFKTRVRVIEQRETLLQNAMAGFVATLPEVDPETPWESLRDSSLVNSCALFLPCDIPLATPFEIDDFVAKSDMQRSDYCVGLTPDSAMAPYYPTANTPGIKMAYFNVKEGRFRQNNLHLAKALKPKNLVYVDLLYKIRYQKELRNVLKAIRVLLSTGVHLLRLIRVFLQLQIAMQLDLKNNHNWLYRLAVRLTPLKVVTRSMGSVMKARLSHGITEYGGAALDIDNAEHLAIAENMADRWREFQSNLHD